MLNLREETEDMPGVRKRIEGVPGGPEGRSDSGLRRAEWRILRGSWTPSREEAEKFRAYQRPGGRVQPRPILDYPGREGSVGFFLAGRNPEPLIEGNATYYVETAATLQGNMKWFRRKVRVFPWDSGAASRDLQDVTTQYLLRPLQAFECWRALVERPTLVREGGDGLVDRIDLVDDYYTVTVRGVARPDRLTWQDAQEFFDRLDAQTSGRFPGDWRLEKSVHFTLTRKGQAMLSGLDGGGTETAVRSTGRPPSTGPR
jgi:hypothetical protein